MYPGHHASFPRRSQPLSATGSQASAMPLGMVHVPSLPQPLSRQPPLRGGGLFIGAAMSNAVKTRQREISAQHPANSKRRSQPKRAPAAQPPQQQHQAGQARRRETKAKHPAQAQAAQPTQTRTGGTAAAAAPSRIYAPNAKLRAPASASGRITPPNAGPRAPTTRTRQRRAAQAAQTAVGVAKIRILLRDDHAESFRQRKVTSHQAKSAFLWGYPVSFGKTKEMGYKKWGTKNKAGRLLRRPAFLFFQLYCVQIFSSSMRMQSEQTFLPR